MDGAFDMMHYGHMNAFRLGRALGTHLIVGVNSDESISQCKGDPLMRDAERLTMVTGCKFVDEVVPGCPYVMNAEYLDYVIKKFRIDYVVHGDDPCIVDGKDVCEFFYFPPPEGFPLRGLLTFLASLSTDTCPQWNMSHAPSMYMTLVPPPPPSPPSGGALMPALNNLSILEVVKNLDISPKGLASNPPVVAVTMLPTDASSSFPSLPAPLPPSVVVWGQ